MNDRARIVGLAAMAGLLVATVSVVGGVWLADALDDSEPVDGEFVLEEPGVYDQPAEEVNRDVRGRTLPEIALLDVDGAPVRLDEVRGTPMVINVWYSTCAPCRRELADFAAVHAEVGSDVRFVGVDPRDEVDTMVRFARERGVDYELLRDDRFRWVADLGIVASPTTLFVDEAGRILEQRGELDAAELRSIIDELF